MLVLSICTKYLTGSVASTSSFYLNSFYSVDEETCAHSQVHALLSA